MNLMHVALAFIVGFLLGGVVLYIALTKFFARHMLQDELTQTRRELANAKRALNEFFLHADDLFMQMDKNYRQFASFLKDGAARMVQNPELFTPDASLKNTKAVKTARKQNGEDIAEKVSNDILKGSTADVVAAVAEGDIKEASRVVQSMQKTEKAEKAAADKAAAAAAKEEAAKAEAEPAEVPPAEQPRDFAPEAQKPQQKI